MWFKTSVMVYKCIIHGCDGLAPSYLASYCKPISSCPGRSHLRSATSGQLNFPRMKTDYGKRSFAVTGPVVWNSLSTELRSPDISLDVFKAKLKTFLSDCWLDAFNVFYSNFALYKILNNNYYYCSFFPFLSSTILLVTKDLHYYYYYYYYYCYSL